MIPVHALSTPPISRFHSVFLWTGYRYNFKSKHSNVKSKNAAFVNISSSLHLMLLQVLAHWLFRRWENCSKLSGHALWKFSKSLCLICWSIRSGWNSRFLANLFDGNVLAMYARYSSLKARVKTMHGKRISQTFLTDHSNQVRHTNWFSCHKRLCFHSFCINYLLFFEMYYIY